MSLEDVESEYKLFSSGAGVKNSSNISNLEVVDLEAPIDDSDYNLLNNDVVDYDIPSEQDNIDVPYEEKGSHVNVRFHEKRGYYQAEEGIIFLSLDNPNDCKMITRKLGIGEFVDTINRDLLMKLSAFYTNHVKFDRDEFVKTLNEEEKKRFEFIVNSTDIYKKESIDDYITIVKNVKFTAAPKSYDIAQTYADTYQKED